MIGNFLFHRRNTNKEVHGRELLSKKIISCKVKSTDQSFNQGCCYTPSINIERKDKQKIPKLKAILLKNIIKSKYPPRKTGSR